MKDSGIEWVGQIPEHWIAKSIRYLVNEHISGSWGNDSVGNENDHICVRIADFNFSQMKLKENIDYTIRNYSYSEIHNKTLKKGDLLIEKSGGGEKTPVGRTVVFRLNQKCLFANFMDCIRLKNEYMFEYAKYCFFALYKNGVTNLYFNQTTGLQNLNIQKYFREVKLPVPPIDEQQKIAEYLDKKCGEIDAITAEIQEQINTLEEYKKSVISETVTKGLNPNVPMKDSGIEWIGKIPANWKIEKGKYCLSYLQKPVRQTDEVITCFRDGEVTLRKNRREDGFTMSDKEIGYQGIDVGDLIVHGMDGFAGAIGISDSRGKASPVLNVLDTNQNKSFIMYYLRSMAYNGVFIALATGIRVRTCDTNWGKLKELPYPLPSKAEQDRIVDYINEQLSQTNDIIADKQEQIKTLEEYKKTLIYEYVTGKKEVA